MDFCELQAVLRDSFHITFIKWIITSLTIPVEVCKMAFQESGSHVRFIRLQLFRKIASFALNWMDLNILFKMIQFLFCTLKGAWMIIRYSLEVQNDCNFKFN